MRCRLDERKGVRGKGKKREEGGRESGNWEMRNSSVSKCVAR